MKKLLMTLVSTLGLRCGASQAALIARSGGMIYDTTFNITWLADMNYAVTSGYAASGVVPESLYDPKTLWTDGRMGWDAAHHWADGLTYGGYSDWRLPTLNGSDASCTGSVGPGYGYNCTGGELGHLFLTDLGNKADESALDPTGDSAEQIANLALFRSVQRDIYFIWSGSDFGEFAWYFQPAFGSQTNVRKSFPLYAMAVRPGDVAAAVPEPQTLALVLLALGATVVTSRTRKPAAPTTSRCSRDPGPGWVSHFRVQPPRCPSRTAHQCEKSIMSSLSPSRPSFAAMPARL